MRRYICRKLKHPLLLPLSEMAVRHSHRSNKKNEIPCHSRDCSSDLDNFSFSVPQPFQISRAKMSAQAFAGSIENFSYESVPRRRPKVSTEVVIFAVGIVLLLGLFIFQQVRVETALRRTEITQDDQKSVLHRLLQLENITQERVTQLDEKVNQTDFKLDEALLSALTEVNRTAYSRADMVQTRISEAKRKLDDMDIILGNYSTEIDELAAKISKLNDIQGQVEVVKHQSQFVTQNISILMEDLEGRRGPFPTATGPAHCGGSLLLGSGVTYLNYRVPLNAVAHGCVWIARVSQTLGSITVTRLALNGEGLEENLSLGIVTNPRYGNCTYLSLSASGRYTFDAPIVFIFFHGHPATAFRLLLQGSVGGVLSPKSFSFEKRTTNFTSKFSPSSEEYSNDELFALLGTSPEGQGANLTITDVHTETPHDWVSLMWMGTTSDSFNCLMKSGRDRQTISGKGERNSPMVVFFHSDVRVIGDGFRVMSESYQ